MKGGHILLYWAIGLKPDSFSNVKNPLPNAKKCKTNKKYLMKPSKICLRGSYHQTYMYLPAKSYSCIQTLKYTTVFIIIEIESYITGYSKSKLCQ